MAQRRSRNRRSSARRSINASGFLDEDTNVYEGNDPLWYDRTMVRASTSLAMTRNESTILNPDSTVEVSQVSANWHNNLSRSNTSKIMEQAIQKNMSERLNNEQNDSSNADPTTESESEHESQKRRANFRAHQAKSNKSEKSNIFLKALEETTESYTRNLKNYTTAQESESEHEYEKKRTRFWAQQKKGDKSEKSNIFLKALEETNDYHTRSLTAQMSKDQESDSTHDESTSNRRLRPKLFQTPNIPTRQSTTGQTSKIQESKTYDESTNKKLSPNSKVELSQRKSNRNSVQKSINKSANEFALAESLNNKSGREHLNDNDNEAESPASSEIFEGNSSKISQLHDESDEENMYDGSFNINETSKDESQSKSVKRKLEVSQLHKVSTMAQRIDNESQAHSESELSHKLQKKNSSKITNVSQKNMSTRKTTIINEDQNTSKTLEESSLHKTVDDSKSISKSRKYQSQNISEANDSTAAHNSDEENSTMPKYIRRTQSRLFQKSQMVDNEDIPDKENNESNTVKNSKSQETSKIREKSSLGKTLSSSQNSKRQTRTSTPNIIGTHESDEENSTIPKYIRRTKSRLFQKSQTANNENVFDDVLNDNSARDSRLLKNSGIEGSQNSKHMSKSMLRDAMNRSVSLLKPRVVLTRMHNADSSTESQKENRLAISRVKNSLSKSKRQVTATEDNQEDKSLPSKSKQQKVSSIEDSCDNSRRKNSPRKSKIQTVSTEENRSNVSRGKNSPAKSKNATVLESPEENQGNVFHVKNSQSKLKLQAVNEVDKEDDVSHGRNSLKKSKQQTTHEISKINENQSLRVTLVGGDSITKEATANERSRSVSHSSVETSSDRTPQQRQEDGALSDSSGLPSDELLHTPNPAQSTLNPSGKPLRRLTQFSFRGWGQESIIAPIVPEPALAAAMRTKTIAEESAKSSPQHLTETSARHSAEVSKRPTTETSPQHSASVSSRHATEVHSRHSERVSPRHSAEAPSRHSAEAPSRHSARVSSRHSAKTSPQNATEIPTRHSAERLSRYSARASTQNAAEASSQHAAEAAVNADDRGNEEIYVDVENESDESEISDYPMLTRQLNEMPYENDRTTDNEEHTLTEDVGTPDQVDEIDQNVSTIDKSAWVEVKKKMDAFKLLMQAQMKREQERRQQEERQKAQTAAALKRIMAQKAAEKRKRQKKPVNKAFLVDGKVYKQPKLPRPQKWATDRLYKYLWKCMEPRYGVRTRVKSEQFILKLANFAKIIQRRKKFENYEADFDDLLKIMAKLNIIETRYDFYRFCSDYMPYSFREKVRPMMMPGNVRNIPYDPELTYKPILSSNDTNDSESESESNEVANQVTPDSASE